MPSSKPDRRCYDRALELVRSADWIVNPALGTLVSGKRRPGRHIGRPLPRGHIQVFLNVDGRHRGILVHWGIWEVAHGPITDLDLVINHKNGDPQDNRLSNLELITQGSNVRHAGALGRLPRGEAVRRAVLGEQQILEIRTRLAAGQSTRSVADVFGVASSTIWKIGQRRTWRHIPNEVGRREPARQNA